MNQEYIQNLKTEYENVTEELTKVTDPAQIKKLSRRHVELTQVIEKVSAVEKLRQELKENQAILNESADEELKAMAAEETAKLENDLAKSEEDLKRLLIPKDPLDAGGALLEIRAGTGGDEASLFAGELLRMYTRLAERKKWKVDVSSISKNELGGVKEAVVEIFGDNVYGHLKYEGGVHRVQRVPDTEKSGRVHTSTASVAVLPQVTEEEFKLDEKDVKIEATTAGGHGGQSVNTTYSAIRMVHLPTGITAQCQDERSQAQNRQKAWRVLLARVAAHKASERDRELRQARKSQIKGAQRSDKIRTYNFPQDRITDHRLNENFHQIENRLDGDIEDIVEQLQELDEKEKLESLEN